MRGLIFDLKRFSVHDGPGIRTTVFLLGCPLRCAWCQNPEGLVARPRPWLSPSRCLGCGACVAACRHAALAMDGDRPRLDPARCTGCGACTAACPSQALEMVGREVDHTEVLAEVLRDRLYFDLSGGGLTLSGGEPLAQPDFALALLRDARAAGLDTAVETSLTADAAVVEALRPHVSLWLVDRKPVDPTAARRWTGDDGARARTNLAALVAAGAAVRLRLTQVPGVSDTPEALAALAAELRALPRRPPVEVLAFNRLPEEKYQRLGQSWPWRSAARDRSAATVAGDLHALLEEDP